MPVALAFAVVGALVAARTGNRLGWLFLAAGPVTAIGLVAYAYAARAATARLPGAVWAAWTFTVVLGITGTLFFLVPLLFPDGRPPSRRWWPVAWIAIIDVQPAAPARAAGGGPPVQPGPLRRRPDRRRFAARLRDAVDLDAVRSDLLTVVNTASSTAHISVWAGPCSPAVGPSGGADQFRVA